MALKDERASQERSRNPLSSEFRAAKRRWSAPETYRAGRRVVDYSRRGIIHGTLRAPPSRLVRDFTCVGTGLCVRLFFILYLHVGESSSSRRKVVGNVEIPACSGTAAAQRRENEPVPARQFLGGYRFWTMSMARLSWKSGDVACPSGTLQSGLTPFPSSSSPRQVYQALAGIRT